MTDEDVVARVARLVDRAIVPLTRRAPHHRQPFATTIKGAAAVALMAAVDPWLGQRRRGQIARAVESAAASSPRRNGRYPPIDALARRSVAHDASACTPDCEISWLAGLLEGEGHFGRARMPSGILYPVIGLQMCDHDVVTRAAVLLRAPGITRAVPRHEAWRPTFSAKIAGAAAAEWMRRLRPLMGERRGAAIDTALASYAPIRLVDPPAQCVVPGCAEPHRSRGLCHTHYMSWLRDVAKGRTPRVTPLR